jgi:FKBP-type peptidyl-prolyl cis-trans isomerase
MMKKTKSTEGTEPDTTAAAKKSTAEAKETKKVKASAPKATKKAKVAVETAAETQPIAPAAVVAEAPKPVAVKRAKAGPQPTVIQANIDVGYGNTLHIRGEGSGLSWERGQPFECMKEDLWNFTIAGAAKPIIFKFLINDETWCTGEDYVVEPGSKITLVPTF